MGPMIVYFFKVFPDPPAGLANEATLDHVGFAEARLVAFAAYPLINVWTGSCKMFAMFPEFWTTFTVAFTIRSVFFSN